MPATCRQVQVSALSVSKAPRVMLGVAEMAARVSTPFATVPSSNMPLADKLTVGEPSTCTVKKVLVRVGGALAGMRSNSPMTPCKVLPGGAIGCGPMICRQVNGLGPLFDTWGLPGTPPPRVSYMHARRLVSSSQPKRQSPKPVPGAVADWNAPNSVVPGPCDAVPVTLTTTCVCGAMM